MEAAELSSQALLPPLEDLQQRQEAAIQALLCGRFNSNEFALKELEQALGKVFAQLRRPRRVIRGNYEEIWALCPFHKDHNVGSFSVNTSYGAFYCFVCGARGGPVKLLKRFGLWDEVMRKRLKGVDLTALMAFLRSQWEHDGHQSMDPLPEQVLAPYRAFRPRRYVQRGHQRHILDSYEVCYDPDHDRILFPVRKATGELVGIQSRVSDNFDRRLRWKWLRHEMLDVCPELFDLENFDEWGPPRDTVMYGEHLVFPGILSGLVGEIVLVEGMGAALRTVATGYSVLASFGTRLGKAQASRLCACAEVFRQTQGHKLKVILAHDGDGAGRAAAVEAEGLLGGYVDASYAPIPSGLDPEEVSPAELRRLLKSSGDLSMLDERGYEACARELRVAMLERLRPHMERNEMRRRQHGSQPESGGFQRRFAQ